MKIMHVLKSNIFSGAEHVVCTIIKNMPKDYECIYVSPDGMINARLEFEQITHYCINKCNVKEIKKAIKELDPDVIHAHDFTASVMCALAATKKQKVISHLHCNPDWLKRKSLNSCFFYIVSKKFSQILIVSDSVKEEYIYSNKIKNKFLTVGNPFSVQEIVDKASICDCAPKSDLIYVGRLSEEKNPLLFIEIVNRLKDKYPHIQSVIVGDGVLKDACYAKIKELQLDSNIVMVGFQENPYIYMKNSKIICIPSKWEGFGLVALEAMALGMPVVGSDVGGLGRIVSADVGYICKNVDDYIKAIEVLGDSAVYCSKSQASVKRAREYDNTSEYVKKIVEIYKE